MPLWVFLVAILAIASVLIGIFLGPEIQNLLGPQKDFQIGPAEYACSNCNISNNMLVGYGNSYNIRVTSINGFTGIVRATATSSPYVNATFGTQYPAAVLTYDPVTMSVPEGNIYFTVQSTKIGNFSITVTGTSGGRSHSLTLSGSVQGLAISANSQPLVVSQHSSANMTVTITSVNRLSGNLTVFGGGGPLWVTLISPTLNCSRCNGLGAPYPLAANASVGVIVMVTWQTGDTPGTTGEVYLQIQVPGLAGYVSNSFAVDFV
jgi:hypothetical protein